MILTIDIGNTTVSLCGVERTDTEGLEARFCAKMDTIRDKDSMAYLATMRQRLEQNGISQNVFKGAVLSSVVPCLIQPVSKAVHALTGHYPVLVTLDSKTGLTMDVYEPDKVGMDRIVDAAWAAYHYPLPLVTVDMGTATTMNVVDEGAIFRGGVIAPGVGTGLDALSTRCAQLPKIELGTPAPTIGKNTAECMLAGTVTAAAAMIDGLVANMERELGKPCTLVITGGLARHVEGQCRHPHFYDPHLLPKGLALIYELNREQEEADVFSAGETCEVKVAAQ